MQILDELRPIDTTSHIASYRDLITYVKDRPGHDSRYAIDSSRIINELNWRPSVTVEQGLEKTVKWYLLNEDWWRPLLNLTGTGSLD